MIIKKNVILSLLLATMLIVSGCGKRVDNADVSTADGTKSTETIETETQTESESSLEEKEKASKKHIFQETNQESKETSSKTSKNVSKEIASSSSDKKAEKAKASSSSKESKASNPQPTNTSDISNDSQPSKPAHTSCTFDGGSVTTNATCNTEGTKTYTCTECGKTKSESIGKTSHNYVTETVQPTCTESGKVKTYCSICGAVESESAGAVATGHSMIESWFGEKPTCTHGGYLTVRCSTCGYVESSTNVPSLEHNKVSDVKTYEDGCEHTIITSYSCADCGVKLWSDDIAFEKHHNWGTVTDEWGDEFNGCTVCGMIQ